MESFGGFVEELRFLASGSSAFKRCQLGYGSQLGCQTLIQPVNYSISRPEHGEASLRLRLGSIPLALAPETGEKGGAERTIKGPSTTDLITALRGVAAPCSSHPTTGPGNLLFSF